MTTEDLYVVAYDYGGSNSTADELVNNKVYPSKEEAEKAITNKETMRVVDLAEWAEECYSSGYICAYG